MLVSSLSPISTVHVHFPGKSLVYNGELLQNNRTFASYGMHSCDSVIAIPEDSSAVSWAAFTKNSDGFDDMIRAVMNNKARMEIMRVHDIRAMRHEGRSRNYRRWLRTFEASLGAGESPRKRFGTVIPDRAESLCEDPLPSLY
jgi:hypothetical protein